MGLGSSDYCLAEEKYKALQEKLLYECECFIPKR